MSSTFKADYRTDNVGMAPSGWGEAALKCQPNAA